METQITDMKQAFTMKLSAMYDGEKQLVEALPKMAQAAAEPKLAEGMRTHLRETQRHVERLEQVAESCGLQLQAKPCAIMQSLVGAGEKVVQSTQQGPVRDAMLIAGAQEVEHHEMAVYGTLVAMAKQLKLSPDAIEMLEDTLQEEKACDEKLNQLAISTVNMQAAAKKRLDWLPTKRKDRASAPVFFSTLMAAEAGLEPYCSGRVR